MKYGQQCQSMLIWRVRMKSHCKDIKENVITTSLRETIINPESGVYSYSMIKKGRRKHLGWEGSKDSKARKEVCFCTQIKIHLHGGLTTCIKAGETVMKMLLKRKNNCSTITWSNDKAGGLLLLTTDNCSIKRHLGNRARKKLKWIIHFSITLKISWFSEAKFNAQLRKTPT